MSESGTPMSCVHCDRGEDQAPLFSLRFKSREVWICSSCLPVLLHRPDRLVGRLPGAESLRPAVHDHD